MTSKASPSKNFEITREALYEQVWSTPIMHLAEKFGVSGSYLARVCTALNVPRPPVGYWQKKAVGKDRPRPDLPAALPGDPSSWTKDKALPPVLQRAVPAKSARTSKTKVARSGRHPMLIGVEVHYRKTRTNHENEFLKPYKQLLPDIVATKNSLEQAIAHANRLYNALEKNGHRVMIASASKDMRRIAIDEREVKQKDRQYGRYSFGTFWTPYRPTITYVGDVPVGLALTEMTERVTMRYSNGGYVRVTDKPRKHVRSWASDHTWTTEQDIPSGRFKLVAYSPLSGVDWTETWQETKEHRFSALVPTIIEKLESSEKRLRSLMAEAEVERVRRSREWEEQQERRKRQEDQRCVEQADAKSREHLSEIMNNWASTMAVERFFQEAQDRAERLDPEQRATVIERLELARAMLGTLDPLEHLEGWLAPDEIYKSKYDQG